MKFVDIRGTQEVLSIEITLPKLCPGYEYYYPDGIVRGFWKKNTYFLKRQDQITRYYLTPQEALEDTANCNLFLKDGKIWIYGEAKVTLKSSGESILEYKDIIDLIIYLDTLESRWGVDMHSLVCLEDSKIDSLYEFKIRRFDTSEA